MLGELAAAFGLIRRRRTLHEGIVERRRIEAIAEELSDLDAGPTLPC